jgi:Domain of unknown function (DUF4440)
MRFNWKVLMIVQEVLRVHRDMFYRSLIDQDYDALADLYANDYMLVRSDGSVLKKEAVLHDLKLGGLTFTTIELVGEEVRIYGETAIVTGESRTLARRGRRATCLALPPRGGLHESGRNIETSALSEYRAPE